MKTKYQSFHCGQYSQYHFRSSNSTESLCPGSRNSNSGVVILFFYCIYFFSYNSLTFPDFPGAMRPKTEKKGKKTSEYGCCAGFNLIFQILFFNEKKMEGVKSERNRSALRNRQVVRNTLLEQWVTVKKRRTIFSMNFGLCSPSFLHKIGYGWSISAHGFFTILRPFNLPYFRFKRKKSFEVRALSERRDSIS